MSSLLAQIIALTSMNLRSILQRIGSSMTAVLGIAVVVSVMLAFLAMAEGFQKTIEGAGSEDFAILLRHGASSEVNSGLSLEQVRLIEDAPGIVRENGVSIASAELYVVVDGKDRETGQPVNLPLRGLDARGLKTRSNVQMLEGRMFESGKSELVVGASVQQEARGLDLGSTVAFGRTEWKVVGVFTANGSVLESELWADSRIVQDMYQRGSTFQSVRVKLETSGDISPLEDYIEQDPRLNLDIETEVDYFKGQAGPISNFIRNIGYPISIVMLMGALAGALNAMYTAVAARTREIATLRTLGFGGFATFCSTVIESLILSLLGAIVGILGAVIFFDGLQTATLGQNFTQIVFDLNVSGDLIAQGIIFALAVGFIGGFFPAIRAARLPLVAAFREI